MSLDEIESWTRSLGGVGVLSTLAVAMTAILSSLQRPAGREEPGARVALRARVLIPAMTAFVVVGAALWRPLPVDPSPPIRTLLLLMASILLPTSLATYLWGMSSLGRMFAPSSGLGVRLSQSPTLVTSGPYSFVRHPMYLAVILAAIASVLLFRTWTTLCFAIMMPGLAVRARREESVLAEEFGPEWAAYSSRVPAWFPRFRSRRKGGA